MHPHIEALAGAFARDGRAAVVAVDRTLSHADFCREASRIADALAAAGVGVGDKVAVLLPRDSRLPPSIFAVWQAGAVYVPLDPAHPVPRLRDMLERIRAAAVLCAPATRSLAAALTVDAGTRIVDVELDVERDVETAASHGDDALRLEPRRHDPRALAYVLFTSGSTGVPKAVAVSHGALAEFSQAIRKSLEIKEDLRILGLSTVTFDISLLELVVAIAIGGCVVLMDEAGRIDPAMIADAIAAHAVNAVQATPSQWRTLLDHGLPLPADAVALAGGEPLETGLAQRMLDLGARVYNGYGPTESTVYTLMRRVLPTARTGPYVEVGGSVGVCRHLLLDPDGRIVSGDGVEGELCIHGGMLAEGYLDDPAETAKRFIAVESPEAGALRVYRTGDRVRRIGDDVYAFIGRNDRQVKIDGNRVELGEIEHALKHLPQVRHAAVKAFRSRDAVRLHAFVTLHPGEDGAAAKRALSEALAARLPSYMRPRAIDVLADMPLNPSGKVDYAALADPHAGAASQDETPCRTPQEAVERQLGAALRPGLSLQAQGGGSLDAIRICHRLQRDFGVRRSVAGLLAAPSVGAWLADLATEPPSGIARPPREGGGGDVPATPAQAALFHFHRMHGGSAPYHVTRAFHVPGIDVDRLEAATAALYARHAALRTALRLHAGEVMQAPLPVPEPALRRLAVDGGEPVAALVARINAEPIDIERDPPARFTLCASAEADPVLIVTVHHLATDGWSMELLIAELGELISGDDPTGPTAGAPAPGFDAYAGALDPAPSADDDRAWRDYLAGAPEVHSLVLDGQRPQQPTFRGGAYACAVPAELSAAMHEVARALGCTDFQCWSALFAMAVGKWSRATDLVIGTPEANRGDYRYARTQGYFAAFVPFRYRFAPEESFADYATRTAAEQLRMQAGAALGIEQIASIVNPPRTPGVQPVTQLAFVFQNYPREPLRTPEGAREIAWNAGFAKFDLLCEFTPQDDGFALRWEYASDLFAPEFVVALDASLRLLARQVAADPHRPIRELRLADAIPPIRPLDAPALPMDSVLDAYARHPVESAARVAVEDADGALDYATLERRANRLAAVLSERHGIGPGARVALAMRRDRSIAVAVLAVLKLGAAYVPVDPAHPGDRIAFILGDSGVGAMVASPAHAGLAGERPLVLIDADGRVAGDTDPEATAPASAPKADDIAYIIYTSGSTGTPKGVCVTHANLLRLMLTTRGLFSFGVDDVWTLFHSLAFDFSVWEFWGALFHGGRLFVVDSATCTDPAKMSRLLVERGVTVLNQTPSAFYALMPRVLEAPRRPSLRWVIFGGEALSPARLAPWFARFGDVEPRLVNMYGITETTVHTTYRPLSVADSASARSPIGGCLPDLAAFVLDDHGQPLPHGAPGELYVAGRGVALGYHDREALTAERFLDGARFGLPGRVYRSGDLARMSWDGAEFDYLGRTDHQVKIRGYRIELGEVEHALLKLPSIAQASATVVADEDGQKQLIAFVVGEGDERALRIAVGAHLPTYMTPHRICVVDEIPVNHNGKADHRRLLQRMRDRDGMRGPGQETSSPFLDIAARLLQRPDLRPSDDFFSVGGDSMRSLRLVAAWREAGWSVQLADLYRHPDFATLERHVGHTRAAQPDEDVRHARFEGLEPGDAALLAADPAVEDAYPLSALQTGMVMHVAREPGVSLYHDVFDYQFALDPDPSRLRRAFAAICAAQPILRTRFRTLPGGLVQTVMKTVEPPFEYRDLRDLDEAAVEVAVAEWIAAEKSRGFDVDGGLLYRIATLRTGDSRIRFLISFHHAVLDGWSIASMISELFSRYASERFEPAPANDLMKRNVLRERAHALEAEVPGFWRTLLAETTSELFPFRLREGAVRRRKVDRVVDPDLCAALTALAAERGVTMQHMLYAMHAKLMQRMLGVDRPCQCVVVGVRPEVADSERAYGLFLNALPVPVDAAGRSVPEIAAQARERLLEIHPHRLYPLALVQRDTGRQFADALFNYTHFHVYDGVFGERVQLEKFAYLEETNFKFYVHYSREVSGNGLTVNIVHDERYIPAQAVAAYLDGLSALCADPTLLTAPELPPPPAPEALSAAEAPATYRSINAMLRARCAELSTRTAIVDGSARLDFAGLGTAVELASDLLRSHGIGPRSVVAVHLPRGLDQVVAILAALNLGACYVPVPVDYPAQRRERILSDAAPDLAIADGEPVREALRHAVESAVSGAIVREPAARGDDHAELPAYLLYTSGTTGRPKGVSMPQRALLNLAVAQALLEPALGEPQSTLQFASIGFDVSIQEIVTALHTGGALHLVDEETRQDISALTAKLVEEGLQRLFLPNAVLQVFVQYANEHGILLPALRCIVSAGEKLVPSRELRRFFARHPEARLVNHYGPSETHVVTAHTLGENAQNWPEDVPIGSPLAGVRIALRGADGRPVAEGVVGELHAAGVCLADGYRGDEALTATRFRIAEAADGTSERWYATGDYAFALDGALHYVGRIDEQTKIRGVRIEIGEIESVLAEHPDVDALAAVVERNGSVARLRIFYCGRATIEKRDFDDRLAAALAEPVSIHRAHRVERMPLNANGKVDRSALLAAIADEADAAPTAPESALLAWLLDQTAELLGTKRPAPGDNFFDLGGHSLLATQLIARINRRFGIGLSMIAAFQAADLGDLARRAEALLDPADSDPKMLELEF